MKLFFINLFLVLAVVGWGGEARAQNDSDQVVLELSMKGYKSSEYSGVRPVLWGRLTEKMILINLKETVFPQDMLGVLDGQGPLPLKSPQKDKVGQETEKALPGKVNSQESKPNLGVDSDQEPTLVETHSPNLEARFSGEDLEGCVRVPKIRDMIFLIESLGDQIQSVAIKSPFNDNLCGEKLRDALKHLGFMITLKREKEGQDLPQTEKKLSVRVEFKAQKILAESKNGELSQDEKAEIIEKAEKSVPKNGEQTIDQHPLEQKVEKPILFINGRPLPVDLEGWFVSDVDPRRDCVLEVRLGDKILFKQKINPYFLKPNEPLAADNTNFSAVLLSEGAGTQSVRLKKVDPEDDFWRFKKISIPIYLELGIGYTMLDPVPTEDVRDRPTAAGQITTQPLFGDLFATFEGHLSTKPGSRIPWTLLAQGFLSQNLNSPLPQLSFPFGVGVRLFKAKVTPQQDVSDIPIVIPESVLGPAIRIGARLKWSRTFSQLMISTTPLKVGDTPLLIDYNPWFSLGYRWTSVTAVILTGALHQIRYPTSQGVVHLGVSSLLLGLQHDLE